jgi:light-regulated signal transduction histidine kinase (bacteriophytochrome)
MDGRGKLTVRTARDGDRVLVEIGDNGPGIPRAAAHILEPFSTTKPVGKGTGLELDICWRIVVERHHGGLRFTLTPATPASRSCCRSPRAGDPGLRPARAGPHHGRPRPRSQRYPG